MIQSYNFAKPESWLLITNFNLLIAKNDRVIYRCLFSNSLRSTENNLIYFLKQLSNKGKRKFSASRAVFSCVVEPCSRVTCCVEIQLKYIFICKIYNLLLQLISAILYDTCYVHGGSNSWEKPMASSAKMEQWSVTLLPIGKPRAVDNMVSMFWGWHFKSSVWVCRAVIGNDATNIYTM